VSQSRVTVVELGNISEPKENGKSTFESRYQVNDEDSNRMRTPSVYTIVTCEVSRIVTA
jgi:hypothetical protein